MALLVVLFLWLAQQIVDNPTDPYNHRVIATQMLAEGFAAHGLTKREASLYPTAIAESERYDSTAAGSTGPRIYWIGRQRDRVRQSTPESS